MLVEFSENASFRTCGEKIIIMWMGMNYVLHLIKKKYLYIYLHLKTTYI